MTYALGIDLGTTYTAASVQRGGRTTIIRLGTRADMIPSVVSVDDDGRTVFGEAADRRAWTEPDRVAREFKRRLGDPTPFLLGGRPFTADILTARLLRATVEVVADREGGEPALTVLTHPANWGPFKLDVLEKAIAVAGLGDVILVSEPEAAAVHYAGEQRVAEGGIVAVYDLGGGTFDAAVLRRTGSGFGVIGEPHGIDRLGGVDIDAAVLGFVDAATGGRLRSVDVDDPAGRAALARLRRECVAAKEALSSDTETVVPVVMPTWHEDVRLTRAELEAMVRPLLEESVAALARAVASADLAADAVDAVLLVGGSSRIPLVAQLVGAELGRPVAIDTDPKYAVASGAAVLAASALATRDPSAARAPVRRSANALAPTELVPAVAPGVTMAAVPPIPPSAAPDPDPVAAAALLVDATATPADRPPDAALAPPPVGASAGAGPVAVAGATAVPRRRRRVAVVAAVLALVVVGGGAAVMARAPGTEAPRCPTTDPSACITSVSVGDAGSIDARFETVGFVPELEPEGRHLHFFFDADVIKDSAGRSTVGDWRVWDAPNPFSATGGDQGRTGYTVDDATRAGATELCVVVAEPGHEAIAFSGNCLAIPGRAP